MTAGKGTLQTAEEGKAGRCLCLYKFLLNAASKMSIKQPCTERPMRCPGAVCVNETYVWRFGMHAVALPHSTQEDAQAC